MVLHSSLIVFLFLLEIAPMKINSIMRHTLFFLVYADMKPFNHDYVSFKRVHFENYSQAIIPIINNGNS